MKTTTTPSLRERKRLAAMKRAQRQAVELFAVRGFDAVTVEEVAAAAEVSPVSLYRWFGTKEGLVLWDEYDPALFAAIAARLADQPPLEAVRDALIDELDNVYAADEALVLARTRLIHHEPALLAASASQMRALEAALARLFADAGVGDGDLDRAVLAGATVGVLVAAIDQWQRHDGAQPLAGLIEDGFAVLRRTPWTS